MKKKIFLCLHGHFYQPPRENAWTNEIEPQPSAAPFHDWNERILQECYKPNSEAVIVDIHDNVIKRVNNYEYFNFNFGPTLLHWIKNKHPRTYSKITENIAPSAKPKKDYSRRKETYQEFKDDMLRRYGNEKWDIIYKYLISEPKSRRKR